MKDKMGLDPHTQKRADRPTQLTPGAKPAQCLALGQVRVLSTPRLTRHLVLFFCDVIAL